MGGGEGGGNPITYQSPPPLSPIFQHSLPPPEPCPTPPSALSPSTPSLQLPRLFRCLAATSAQQQQQARSSSRRVSQGGVEGASMGGSVPPERSGGIWC